MNPHAEAADRAIRLLQNAVEAAPAASRVEAARVQLASDDLRTARMLRQRRAYAKATRRATTGLDRLADCPPCSVHGVRRCTICLPAPDRSDAP